MCNWRPRKRRETENGAEVIFEKVMAKKSSMLMKTSTHGVKKLSKLPKPLFA